MMAAPNTNFGTRARIRIPASTSNPGPAFDAVGLALQLFLTLEVREALPEWRSPVRMRT